MIVLFGTYAGEEVTSGQIDINLKWGIIPLPAQKQDLCDALKQSGKACPLEPGTQTMTIAQQIPKAAPSVSYSDKFLGGSQKHHVSIKCLCTS